MLEFRSKYALGSLGPSSMKPSSASIVALRLVALASRGWGKPFLQQLASSGVGSRPQLQISLLVQPSLVNSSLPIGWCGNVRLGRSTGPKQRVQRDPRKSCQEILGLDAADHWAPIKGLFLRDHLQSDCLCVEYKNLVLTLIFPKSICFHLQKRWLM